MDDQHRPARPGFRLRPLLILAILGAAAAVVGAFTTLIRIDAGPDASFEVGTWMVNDFGTNNAVAGVLAAGSRWSSARWRGAPATGGAPDWRGALGLRSPVGWRSSLGLAEWPIADAEAAAALVPTQITRDVGYWALVGAGAVGAARPARLIGASRARPALGVGSLDRRPRRGVVPHRRRRPVDPGGNRRLVGELLLRHARSSSSRRCSSSGRGVQLGLLALVGVVGFLLVRRYGLGLAVGSADRRRMDAGHGGHGTTDSPIGPGFANPGAEDLQPHAVTIVGMRHGRLLRRWWRSAWPSSTPIAEPSPSRGRHACDVPHCGRPPLEPRSVAHGLPRQDQRPHEGSRDQVKDGIDKVSDTVEKKVPAHAEKIDAASDKAKDVVDQLGGKDDAAAPAAPAAPADASGRHRRPHRPPPLAGRHPAAGLTSSPDANEERDPLVTLLVSAGCGLLILCEPSSTRRSACP